MAVAAVRLPRGTAAVAGLRRLAFLVVFGALGAASCGAPRFTIPLGGGVPRSDGETLRAQALATCLPIDALGGDWRISGRVAGQRVAGLQLLAVFDGDGRVALEGRVASTLLFSLRGSSDDAALVLHDERMVVTGRVEELLDALAGIPAGPKRLMAVLSGCVSAAPVSAAETLGALVRLRTSDADLYLEQQRGRWRVRAGRFDGVLSDYRYRETASWPASVRLSTHGNGPVVDLTFEPGEIETTRRDPAVFVPRVPDGYEKATMEWLARNGPLRR